MSFSQTLEVLDLVQFTGANPAIRSDLGSVFVYTGVSGALTKTISAPLTGYSNHVWVKNSTAFVLTIEPNEGDIDGAADLTVLTNEHYHLFWNGTVWLTI